MYCRRKVFRQKMETTPFHLGELHESEHFVGRLSTSTDARLGLQLRTIER